MGSGKQAGLAAGGAGFFFFSTKADLDYQAAGCLGKPKSLSGG
jgi:hypothetical protein